MSSKSPEYSISPLFYDALSKEFQPVCDSRTHTLGRLASATILKGDIEFGQIYQDEPTYRYVKYTYQPSWAKGVRSIVSADLIGDNHALLHSIRLESQPGNSLRIERDTRDMADDTAFLKANPDFKEAARIGLNGTHTWREIALGEKLSSARNCIARATEEFFIEYDNGSRFFDHDVSGPRFLEL